MFTALAGWIRMDFQLPLRPSHVGFLTQPSLRSALHRLQTPEGGYASGLGRPVSRHPHWFPCFHRAGAVTAYVRSL